MENEPSSTIANHFVGRQQPANTARIDIVSLLQRDQNLLIQIGYAQQTAQLVSLAIDGGLADLARQGQIADSVRLIFHRQYHVVTLQRVVSIRPVPNASQTPCRSVLR